MNNRIISDLQDLEWYNLSLQTENWSLTCVFEPESETLYSAILYYEDVPRGIYERGLGHPKAWKLRLFDLGGTQPKATADIIRVASKRLQEIIGTRYGVQFNIFNLNEESNLRSSS